MLQILGSKDHFLLHIFFSFLQILQVLIMFKLFFLLFCISVSYSCPENCFCTEFSAQCVLLGCDSVIDTTYDTLIIEGSLCKYHRQILQNLEDLTDVFLVDDQCYQIPNCRFVFFKKVRKMILCTTFISYNIYFKQHLSL